jgi:mRNA interferase MazF
MMMDLYKKGEVIVLPFPFIDSEFTKRRPAVVLSNDLFNINHSYVVVGMITTAKKSSEASDIKLRDWKKSGLKKACLFRFKIFSVQKNLIIEKAGSLSTFDRTQVFRQLNKCFN